MNNELAEAITDFFISQAWGNEAQMDKDIKRIYTLLPKEQVDRLFREVHRLNRTRRETTAS